MPFGNPILAGSTLARIAMQSEGYVPLTTGWAIYRDGTIDMNNGIFRGVIEADGNNNSYVRVSAIGGTPQMTLYPGDPGVFGLTATPAQMFTGTNIAGASGALSTASLSIVSPSVVSATAPDDAEIDLVSQSADLSIPAKILTLGRLLDKVTGHEYAPGQNGTVNLSFSAVSSFTQAVPFTNNFRAVPIIKTNISSGNGVAAQWHSRGINPTISGFTLLVFSTAASTWANIPVQWEATEPTL